MDLKVLGCHGGETPKHRTSSFLIDDSLAIDAGAITSALSLREQERISSILVSHPHMDHIRDLATMADNRCQQGGPTLQIVGTQATLQVLKKHFFNDLLWPDFSKIDTKNGATISYRTIEENKPSLIDGKEVVAIPVNHTIDTVGFVIRSAGKSIAYSGDTGPTDLFWKTLNNEKNLQALLMEVSFPNDQKRLASQSGHHTPETLKDDLLKFQNNSELPILLYHIKPVFEKIVEKELASIKNRNLKILQIGDHFSY